ncbi:MAG: tol-pal system protein YbgF [Gammaproteobacteria bacterium]|nr:tol-pal system protein YbgF [Gammaproteobacteria bacterium]MDD9895739.1 tol-pal system protein YbgF [Gammaproteobacteria bacterium]MDD9959618.1 tol-pal system protein YbgF [Gammaproteobacteria bacterium]
MNRTLGVVASRVLVGSLASIFAVAATAQVGGAVVESQGFTPGQASQANTQSSSPNNDALSLLLDQNQQLRSEVQALRALVEEQGFEIRKLQRDSLSRYTNVDDRLSSLEANGVVSNSAIGGAGPTDLADIPPNNPSTDINNTIPNRSPSGIASTPLSNSTANTTASTNSSIATPRTTNRNTGRGTLQPAVLSEQQLYQMAYDSVINSNFERSIAEFDQYLNIYPEGRFVTNAHYWKGQAYLYLNRFNEAKDSYEIILNQYEDSAKLPDAMYGLGLAYQGLGNIPQARQLLNEIKRRFPNTGVANLADTRLLQLD